MQVSESSLQFVMSVACSWNVGNSLYIRCTYIDIYICVHVYLCIYVAFLLACIRSVPCMNWMSAVCCIRVSRLTWRTTKIWALCGVCRSQILGCNFKDTR